MWTKPVEQRRITLALITLAATACVAAWPFLFSVTVFFFDSPGTESNLFVWVAAFCYWVPPVPIIYAAIGAWRNRMAEAPLWGYKWCIAVFFGLLFSPALIRPLSKLFYE